jgi:hypothetical protein
MPQDISFIGQRHSCTPGAAFAGQLVAWGRGAGARRQRSLTAQPVSVVVLSIDRPDAGAPTVNAA